MTKHQERRILLALLKRLEQSPNPHGAMRLVRPFLWILLVAGFTALFQWAPTVDTRLRLAIVGSAIIGAVVGVILYFFATVQQWPVVRPHLSIESIKKRIRELET